MKKVLFLALLVSCTAKGPTYTPIQESVINYAQHIEPDSAHYVPLRFGKPQDFTRADSLRPTVKQYTELSDALATLMMGTAKIVDLQTRGRAPAAVLARSKRRNDSISTAFKSMTDARLALVKAGIKKVVVGKEITHSWRVGERVDSAHFIVFNNGAVTRLN
jgi:hypothetical protein